MAESITLLADRSILVKTTESHGRIYASAKARLYTGETVAYVEHVYTGTHPRVFVVNDMTQRANNGRTI